jgi:proline dehydrogenase
MITHWGFARRAAARFVAGETPDDALRAVQELNVGGILATLDHLGENTATREDALQATEDALVMLDAIQRAELHSNISIKLSQLGLKIDSQLCLQNLLRILERARDYHSFVRIDMEESAVVDRTLTMYWEARRQGFDNLGVVIQSYLYRSDSDVQELLPSGARVRLVKGAYREPPSLAFPKKKDVDANYDRLACRLLDQTYRSLQQNSSALNQDGRIPPIAAIATHDPVRIANAQAYASQIGLPKEAIEFQLLYGIRRDLQSDLAAQGFPVRIYVPYGTQWYPYFMRRLAERPANLWFFLSNLVRK